MVVVEGPKDRWTEGLPERKNERYRKEGRKGDTGKKGRRGGEGREKERRTEGWRENGKRERGRERRQPGEAGRPRWLKTRIRRPPARASRHFFCGERSRCCSQERGHDQSGQSWPTWGVQTHGRPAAMFCRGTPRGVRRSHPAREIRIVVCTRTVHYSRCHCCCSQESGRGAGEPLAVGGAVRVGGGPLLSQAAARCCCVKCGKRSVSISFGNSQFWGEAVKSNSKRTAPAREKGHCGTCQHYRNLPHAQALSLAGCGSPCSSCRTW